MRDQNLPRAPDVEDAGGPDPKDVALVRDLAERARSLVDEIGAAEAELTRRKNELKVLTERDLPAAMAAARLEAWPMRGGASFELTQVVSASIPKEPSLTKKAHEWLEAHGHGDVIKHRFTISFGRGDEAWARKFEADLRKRKRPLNVERRDWVEPQTLSALVREQLREAARDGRDPEELAPSATLGVFRLTVARLVEPKRKEIAS